MKLVTFFDLEIQPESLRILDIGAVKNNNSYFHASSKKDFTSFLKESDYLCGHNVIHHDCTYITDILDTLSIPDNRIIDTLYWSPLLFPEKPYHHLVKDEKLHNEDINNPVSDSKKARILFDDEVAAFNKLEPAMQDIFYALLHNKKEFTGFFDYLDYSSLIKNPEALIMEFFSERICTQKDLRKIIMHYPMELAYALAIINTNSKFSVTPAWVIRNFPMYDYVMKTLRNHPCFEGCVYCEHQLDPVSGLRKHFGFEAYRTFNGEPLQENAVRAALDHRSLLAIFPTGGGKSLTFQIPALMAGDSVRGLTIVISPLQSLMKDQVDNLENTGIVDAVTINGLLDPIERAKAIERVADGSASILYISPESLRSKTIEHLLVGRKIVRFVIDEAHCFSSWGQDFRVDYLYIADFIKALQEKKNLGEPIPVSCFTATAKPQVVADILAYFREYLYLDLELFQSKTGRTNLTYKVLEKESEEEKYNAMRNLIESRNCPSIVYVSRTYKAEKIAERLQHDGFYARAYHGKMESKIKTENQNLFIAGDVDIIVATSAFGMGVDKKDVGLVIHFEISDSLENYVQEAGRAGRDEKISAECVILYNEEDLHKHFLLLNQAKINLKEIQQIWTGIKKVTKYRDHMSSSALEIARSGGWGDDVNDLETRVKTAVSALEQSGYLKRGQNMPRVYANSILCNTYQEAEAIINQVRGFSEQEKINASRIIKKLISSKNRKEALGEDPEERIEYISDQLGIIKEEVIHLVGGLKEAGILADFMDLTAYISKEESYVKSKNVLQRYKDLELFLLDYFAEEEGDYNVKEINERAKEKELSYSTPQLIKRILGFWSISKFSKYQKRMGHSENIVFVFVRDKEELREKMIERHQVADFVLSRLFTMPEVSRNKKDEVLIEFSVLGLISDYSRQQTMFKNKIQRQDMEETLFYLTKIGAITIEGGFLVLYNRMKIERKEKDNLRRYRVDDYKALDNYYKNKIQQIHIVGEYARKMAEDYQEALQFVDDYFNINYDSFLKKYFGDRINEISKNLTPAKMRQLFGELSEVQRQVIDDDKSENIAVIAGPGSGKTKLLVHKLASLVLLEDVKFEQLLMLTFSRAAVNEFKKRLITLIGNATLFIEIKTFHSYCFDILGMVGSTDKTDGLFNDAVKKIKDGEVEASKITKTVLVVDEAQDMDQEIFDFLQAIIDFNNEMRVIIVGDDDQNIFEFRGSSSKYMKHFINQNQARTYELLDNYRSKKNLITFTNQFALTIPNRLKKNETQAVSETNGEIVINYYKSKNIIVPFVDEVVATERIGNSCILTNSNKEALQITGLLLKRGIRAKLIQSNDSFNLYHMNEIRFFINRLRNLASGASVTIDEWEDAKRELFSVYQRSSKLDLCKYVIRDFEQIYRKEKYLSDFDVFIKESKIEDFFNELGETIFVSTIHKAKGKEFDHVFLLLENFSMNTDERRRILYVAMTRAKNNLTVFTNKREFVGIEAEDLVRIEDVNQYPEPDEMVVQLGHRDVALGYFAYWQKEICNIISGDPLFLSENVWLMSGGKKVLKFSEKFARELQRYSEYGYSFRKANVDFVVYWKDEQKEEEVRILLPVIHLIRKT